MYFLTKSGYLTTSVLLVLVNKPQFLLLLLSSIITISAFFIEKDSSVYYGVKKNITFSDIAKYTGFSKTTISRYFNNPDSLTLENQQIIADALEKLKL